MKHCTVFALAALLATISCTKIPAFVSSGSDQNENSKKTAFIATLTFIDGAEETEGTEAVDPSGTLYISSEDKNTTYSAAYTIDGSEKYRIASVRPGVERMIFDGLSGLRYGVHYVDMDVTCNDTKETARITGEFRIFSGVPYACEWTIADGKGNNREIENNDPWLYMGERVTMKGRVSTHGKITADVTFPSGNVSENKRMVKEYDGEDVVFTFYAKGESVGTEDIVVTYSELQKDTELRIPLSVVPVPSTTVGIWQPSLYDWFPDGRNFYSYSNSGKGIQVELREDNGDIYNYGYKLETSDPEIMEAAKDASSDDPYTFRLYPKEPGDVTVYATVVRDKDYTTEYHFHVLKNN